MHALQVYLHIINKLYHVTLLDSLAGNAFDRIGVSLLADALCMNSHITHLK